MDNKFILMWEDNPDTPLTADNLSKSINFNSEGSLLYMDDSTQMTYPDNKLKFRNNSKISIKIPVTNAFFDFNDSVVSHDSEYSPTSFANNSYRIESSTPDSKSIAIEDATSNLVLNSSFESSFTSWTTDFNTSNISISNNYLYGSYSAKLDIDALGDRATLSQIVSVPSDSYVSISFYYKNTAGDLKVLIIGDPSDPVNKKYWKSIGARQWEAILSEGEITLPDTDGEWTRFEIPDIYTTGLLTDEIEIRLYSEDAATSHEIDAVQLEELRFCSSYTNSIRGEPDLEYSPDILRLKQGSIDILVTPKWFEGISNLLIAKLSAIDDAIKLYFNAANNSLNFEVYDTNITDFKKTSLIFSNLNDDLKDQELRIIVSWNQDSGIKLFLNYGTNELNNSSNGTFIPFSQNLLTSVQIGGRYETGSTEVLNGIIDNLKINSFEKSETSISEDITSLPQADSDLYHIFENINKSIEIHKGLLDSGLNFSNNSYYYIWVCDDFETPEDTATVVVSLNANAPSNYDKIFCRKIGGFKTDGSGNILNHSIWDIGSFENKVIQTERLVVHGTDSESNSIEFRSTQYGGVNDATFNVLTNFTEDVHHTNDVWFGAIDQIHVDPSGFVDIDNIRIDGNSINSLNGLDTRINSDNDIVVYGDRDVVIKSNTGLIHVDNIRIKNGNIYALTGNNLVIENDNASSTLQLNSNGGQVEVIGTTTNIHPTETITLNSANVDIDGSIGISFNSPWISITSSSGNVDINSGSGVITLDNIVANGNQFSTVSGDLTISATGSIYFTKDTNIQSNVLNFGSTARQMLNLYGTSYALGVQASTAYFRSTDHFVWYRNGSHNNALWNAGGGSMLAALTNDSTGPSGVIDANSRFYAGRVHNAIYNDLAECWDRDPNFKKMNILYKMAMVQTLKGIRPSMKRAEKGSIGIVSNTYGFLLNDKDFNEKDLIISKSLPIAISGRAKVLVYKKKKLSIGNEVVSNKFGTISKANFFEKIFMRDRILGRVDIVSEDVWIKVY